MRRLSCFALLVFVFASGSFVAAQIARVGGGDIVFEVEGATPAQFRHASHVGKGRFTCQACHPKLFVTRAKHVPATMAHMETRRSSCGACHDGKKAFSVADQCDKCHVEK